MYKMKHFHRNDINAFLKTVPKEQKVELLNFLLTLAKSNAKKTIQEKYNIARFTKQWNKVFYKTIQN